jgi:hypothetical protein
MAQYVFKDAYVMINSVNYSASIKSISFPLASAELDSTAMGATWETFALGLKSGSFTLNFKADNTNTSGLNESLWNIFDGNAAVAYILKPNGSTTGATNPKWTGNCVLTSCDFISGTVGDLAMIPATFKLDGASVRAEAD